MLAFGAGALISAVSFDLAQEGLAVGGAGYVGGARGRRRHVLRAHAWLERRGRSKDGARRGGPRSGRVPGRHPEQLVLGIGIAVGEGVSVGLLFAIFVSNLPEAIGSSTEMWGRGRGPPRSVACGCSSR